MTTKTKTPDFHQYLTRVGACSDAVAWAEGLKSAKAAWETCERGDWMLWIAAKLLDRKIVVMAACQCARLALQHVPKDETRPLKAIETAEAWCRGEATAADAAHAAHAAAAAYAAADAAYAAAAAAYAAAAADAAYAAAHAAAYAAHAAHAAAADAHARTKCLKECADLVRKQLTWEVIQAAWLKGKQRP